MQNTSTQLNLLLYIYNELPPKEAEEMKQLINECPELTQEYNSLSKTVAMVNDLDLKPSKQTLNNIFNYSKTSGTFASKHCNEIDLRYN